MPKPESKTKPKNEGYLATLDRRLKLVLANDFYARPKYNSFMSGTEWRNVEIEREFAQFLKSGKSMFQFPYFRQIFDLWKVTFNSFLAARKYDRSIDILISEYGVMDAFVTVFTSMEMLPKGIVALMLRSFIRGENDTEIQKHLAEYYEKYAADLETVPFYDQDYKKSRADLAELYSHAANKTWGDWFSWKSVSIQLFARRWLSKPLHAWFHDENNVVNPNTAVLVKFKAEDETDGERAKQQLLSAVQDMPEVKVIENHVYARPHKTEKSYTSVYALLNAHRYDAFRQDLASMTEKGIELKKIAGQDQVQVKVEINATDAATMQQRMEELKHIPNATMRYSYGDGIHAGRQLCMFDVPVRKLQETVDELNDADKHRDVKVAFIHNF